MKRAFITAAVTTAAVGAVLVAHVPACASDDGSGAAVCYWAADTRGDGRGVSFIKVGDHFIQVRGM